LQPFKAWYDKPANSSVQAQGLDHLISYFIFTPFQSSEVASSELLCVLCTSAHTTRTHTFTHTHTNTHIHTCAHHLPFIHVYKIAQVSTCVLQVVQDSTPTQPPPTYRHIPSFERRGWFQSTAEVEEQPQQPGGVRPNLSRSGRFQGMEIRHMKAQEEQQEQQEQQQRQQQQRLQEQQLGSPQQPGPPLVNFARKGIHFRGDTRNGSCMYEGPIASALPSRLALYANYARCSAPDWNSQSTQVWTWMRGVCLLCL
jgi:hypothetical protein